jgi:hypothetical protein
MLAQLVWRKEMCSNNGRNDIQKGEDHEKQGTQEAPDTSKPNNNGFILTRPREQIIDAPRMQLQSLYILHSCVLQMIS